MRFPIFIALLFTAGLSTAQDIHFSQYYQSPLFVNPAYSGSANGIRTVLNYKNQWASVTSPFKTFAFAFDANALKKNWDRGYVGTGITFFSDKAGDIQLGTTSANLNVAVGLYTSDNSNVSLGLQGNFIQQSINTSNIKADAQYINGAYDPSASIVDVLIPSQNSMDFSAGAQYTYGKSELSKTKIDEFTASGGVAYYHITQPDQSFFGHYTEAITNKIVIHGTAHIGANFGKTTSFIPSFVSSIQGPSKELILGCLIRNQLKQDSRYTGFVKSTALLFGGHYRWADSFILSVLYENSGFGFGLSYDMNTSGLRSSSGGKGGFEISARYVNLAK